VTDKYDDAIEWLVEHADERFTGCSAVFAAWSYPDAGDPYGLTAAHVLFQAANASGYAAPGDRCGCITQIREGRNEATTADLTAAIRADARLPSRIRDIEKLRGDELRAALQPFAEWQRRLDREIRQPALAKPLADAEGAE